MASELLKSKVDVEVTKSGLDASTFFFTETADTYTATHHPTPDKFCICGDESSGFIEVYSGTDPGQGFDVAMATPSPGGFVLNDALDALDTKYGVGSRAETERRLVTWINSFSWDELS